MTDLIHNPIHALRPDLAQDSIPSVNDRGGLAKSVFEVAVSQRVGRVAKRPAPAGARPGISAISPLYQFATTDYDALNRLRQVTIAYLPGDTKTLSYDYDRFGNRSGVTLGEGAQALVHSYQHNKLNRLHAASLPGSQDFQFTHLGNDDLDVITHPNGLTTDYAYETHGPVQSIAVTGGPQPVSILDYLVRDEFDRVKTLRETIGAQTFTWDYDYDNGGRLDDASYPSGRGLPFSEDFAYDLVGNREDPNQVSNPDIWDYDANDRIQTSPSPSRTYAFDDDGNVESVTEAGATTSFSFDVVNQLQTYQEPGTSVSYAYDPFGRRIRKIVDDGTPETTWYLWDGDRLLVEYDDPGGNRIARYAYIDSFAPRQYAMGSGATETIYDVHTDHLDTPRALTDANGVVVWRAAYEAFGMAAIDEDPDGDSTMVGFYIRFPGQYEDEESGLHYNRHRYFDPSLGRYISADPIGQQSDPNLYLYAANSPTVRIDPLGLVDVLSPRFNDGVDLMQMPTHNRFGDPLGPLGQEIDDAFDAERRNFPPGWDDPYDGGYRHCVAACLLRRKYGEYPARAGVAYWDCSEESESDRQAEQEGLEAAEGEGSCEVECLRVYPNVR